MGHQLHVNNIVTEGDEPKERKTEKEQKDSKSSEDTEVFVSYGRIFAPANEAETQMKINPLSKKYGSPISRRYKTESGKEVKVFNFTEKLEVDNQDRSISRAGAANNSHADLNLEKIGDITRHSPSNIIGKDGKNVDKEDKEDKEEEKEDLPQKSHK